MDHDALLSCNWGVAVCIIGNLHSSQSMHAGRLFCEVSRGGLQKHSNVATQGMARFWEQHLQEGFLVNSSSAHARPGLVLMGCWFGDAKLR